MAAFFIDRPIFAWVLAIVLMLAGVLAIRSLPVAQYPDVAPPAIAITVTYPGASAETVQNTVVQVIEQQLNGLDHLLYFSSESDKDGSMTITLTFAPGTNSDIAQVQVQNKLAQATPLLPLQIQQQGIRVAKSTVNFLMAVGFISTDGSMNAADIADYVASHVEDPISRTPGVGDYNLFGSQYAMRIWLDPARLNNYGLTPVDISSAVQAQNVQISSGELGGLPAVKGQQLNATIVGPSLLQTPEQFGAILLRVNADGSQVRLRDVARVELGAESYAFDARFNGMPATGIGVKLAAGANALATSDAVKATVERLKPFFPRGLQAVYPYDTTPFVRLSIHEVMKALAEAILLVFLVMYLFIQNLRATLIPTIAIPVVLLGTFAVLSALGYSINVLTLFAMVLAIGLLVDDAIVVVENVERVMAEEHLSPRDATRLSMKQISGALVGIALVLSAVFLPMAFFGGSTGVIYRQFSITIVSAMALSVLVALILTPALCATMLKQHAARGKQRQTGFFAWFNGVFLRSTQTYERGVTRVLRSRGRYLIVYGVIILGMAFLYTRVPSSFLPDEDQGFLFVQVNAPTGATKERTGKALDEMREYFMTQEKEAVKSVFTIAGFSFAGRGQSSGLAFVMLKDWNDRPGARSRVKAIAERAQKHFDQMRDAQTFAFAPPAIIELGNASGFDFELVDRAGLGHDALMQARNQLLQLCKKDPGLKAMRANGLSDEPQYRFDIDWEKARVLGLTVNDINSTFGTALGSSYIDQFIDRGRVKKVYMQGEAFSRMLPQDLGNWFVRNGSGNMVPYSAFSSAQWVSGSPKLERYNGVPAVEIVGEPAPGHSSGEAIETVERLAAQLPPGIGYEWTGLSFQELQSGSQAPALYAISLTVVFL